VILTPFLRLAVTQVTGLNEPNVSARRNSADPLDPGEDWRPLQTISDRFGRMIFIHDLLRARGDVLMPTVVARHRFYVSENPALSPPH
jgi:hypothetical protein